MKQAICSLHVGQPHRRHLQYLLHRPAGMQSSSGRWPLLLFLHGAGERGNRIQSILRHGPPKIATLRPDFPFIVISPQCPAGETWEQQPLTELLDQVEATENVDLSRVYGTGISMGGYGVWHLAVNHPDRFAAMAPICGGGHLLPLLLLSTARRTALEKLPLRAYHGARDKVVPLAESERMVRAYREAGGSCDLVIYPEAAHDAWTQTYSDPALWKWFLEHQRRRPSKKSG